MPRIRILTFSTLYPSESMPRHGIFVENRLRQLLASGEVESRVVAPVPWFPFRHHVFGSFADFARVPRDEKRHGVGVSHPRYLLIPKIGMAAAPVSMAAGTTILGMIPLVPDPMFGGMAVTIMGGLFVATLLTIIVLPAFYAIIFRLKREEL